MQKTRICENCGRPVPLYAYEEHLEVCRKYVDKIDVLLKNRGGTRSQVKVKQKKKGRKCLICGKDPSPNYFYCPSCQPEDPYYGY